LWANGAVEFGMETRLRGGVTIDRIPLDQLRDVLESVSALGFRTQLSRWPGSGVTATLSPFQDNFGAGEEELGSLLALYALQDECTLEDMASRVLGYARRLTGRVRDKPQTAPSESFGSDDMVHMQVNVAAQTGQLWGSSTSARSAKPSQPAHPHPGQEPGTPPGSSNGPADDHQGQPSTGARRRVTR